MLNVIDRNNKKKKTIQVYREKITTEAVFMNPTNKQQNSSLKMSKPKSKLTKMKSNTLK